MFKLVLEKAEEPEIKLPTSAGSWKKAREFQRNIYFCFIDYAKAFVWVTKNCGKFFKNGNTRLPDLLLEKSVCRTEATEDWTWKNRLIPNWERSMSSLYIVTPLI